MPDDKLKQFYQSIKSNPNVVGIPDDYNVFQNSLKDTNTSKAFFDAISKNEAIVGLPKDYNIFASSLGLVEKKNPNIPTESYGLGVSTASKGSAISQNLVGDAFNITPKPKKTTNLPTQTVNKKTPTQEDERGVVEKVNDYLAETITQGGASILSGITGAIGGFADLGVNKTPDKKKWLPMSNEWVAQKIQQQGTVKNPEWYTNQGIAERFMGWSKKLSEVAKGESDLMRQDLGVDPNKSFVDHISDGNYGKAAKDIVASVSEQAVQLAAIYGSGGSNVALGAMGAVASGQNLQEQYSQDQDINLLDTGQAILISVPNSFSER